MLQRFSFIIFIVTFITFLVIKIAVPMWRFMIRADSAIQIYMLLKPVLDRNFVSSDGPVEIPYGKYKIKFTNADEASTQMEELAKDALSYYDKLGYISKVIDDFEPQKKELIRIISEIKKWRWKMQTM